MDFPHIKYERGLSFWFERGEFWPRTCGYVTSGSYGWRSGFVWVWRFHFGWQL